MRIYKLIYMFVSGPYVFSVSGSQKRTSESPGTGATDFSCYVSAAN